MIRLRLIGCVLFLGLSLILTAACRESKPDPVGGSTAPPDTDIFLADIVWTNGTPSIGAVKRITNRPNYDNQPRFVGDGSGFYLTSTVDGNPEIYFYRLADGEMRRITETPDREYSADVIPGSVGFSAVRVEEDGKQRLWRYDENGANPEVVIRWDIYPVAYYAWLGEQNVALVLADETPFNLSLADVPTQRMSLEPVDVNVGRCLRPVGTSTAIDKLSLAYVSKGAVEDLVQVETADGALPEGPTPRTIQDYTLPADGSWLRSFALADGASRTWIQLPDGVEDFDLTADGGVFIGHQSQLLYWIGQPGESEGDPPSADAWNLVGDLASHGVKSISRLSVSPNTDKIAFVSVR